MRSKHTEFFRAAIAAAVALLTGCGDSESPTAPVAAPPLGNIAGAWTGTYNVGGDVDCYTGISLPAQASFEQNGSTIVGTLTTTGACGFDYAFQGTLSGNALAGGVERAPFAGSAYGTLTGTTLDITVLYDSCGCPGRMQLRR